MSASGRTGRSSPIVNTKFECVCMEFVQSSWGGPGFHYKLVECRSSGHAEEVETQEVGKTTCGSSEGRSEEIEVGRGYQGGVFPRVVV